MHNTILPAEWHEQYAVALTFPHAASDWAPDLERVTPVFIELIHIISIYEHVVVVCDDIQRVRQLLPDVAADRVTFVAAASNDTWARDHMPLTVLRDGKAVLMKYRFNGWGLKFPAHLDNVIAYAVKKYPPFENIPMEEGGIVLEGGAVESDGAGTFMSTTACMGSLNRNPHLSLEKLEALLAEQMGFHTFLWLHNGYLAGDDTDSHIDTLARFTAPGTIAYITCHDEADEHYAALKRMERELVTFRTAEGNPFKLVPLPMAPAIYDEDGQRLPATYANFLIINKAVLVPVYGHAELDGIALDILAGWFSDREIIARNCEMLIRQHGSLHCVTMQFPVEVNQA